MAIKKRVLVTGANGYVGAQIVSMLVREGHEVIAHIRKENQVFSEKFPTAELVLGDISKEATLDKLCALNLDTIIHTISLDHHQSNLVDLKTLNEINVHATWRLLDGFAQKNVKFIYLSTIHVLGQVQSPLIDENSTGFPKNKYALTHALCEHLVDYYAKSGAIDALSIRLSNGFGSPVFQDNNCWWIVVNDFCKNAVENGVIKLSSDGSPIRNFIHIEDIFQGIRILMVAQKDDQNLYHLCTNNTYSILETAKLVQEVCKNKFKIQIDIDLPEVNKTASQVKMTYSYERLEAFGYKPQISLEKGIEEVIDYLKKR